MHIIVLQASGKDNWNKEYYEVLRKRFVYFQKIVQEYRLKQQYMASKDKSMTQYKNKPGNLVYLISPQTSLPKTSSRKFIVIYVEPLVTYKMINFSTS